MPDDHVHRGLIFAHARDGTRSATRTLAPGVTPASAEEMHSAGFGDRVQMVTAAGHRRFRARGRPVYASAGVRLVRADAGYHAGTVGACAATLKMTLHIGAERATRTLPAPHLDPVSGVEAPSLCRCPLHGMTSVGDRDIFS